MNHFSKHQLLIRVQLNIWKQLVAVRHRTLEFVVPTYNVTCGQDGVMLYGHVPMGHFLVG
jgi:hypothetical protein